MKMSREIIYVIILSSLHRLFKFSDKTYTTREKVLISRARLEIPYCYLDDIELTEIISLCVNDLRKGSDGHYYVASR